MQPLKIGSRVLIATVLPNEQLTRSGVPLTRADYLTDRAQTAGRTGTIIGFPAGHVGVLWKVELNPKSSDDTAGGADAAFEIKVYAPSELVCIDKTQLAGSAATEAIRRVQVESLAEMRTEHTVHITREDWEVRPRPGIDTVPDEGEFWVRASCLPPSEIRPERLDEQGFYNTLRIVSHDAAGNRIFVQATPTVVEAAVSATDARDIDDAIEAMEEGGAAPLGHVMTELDFTASGTLQVMTFRTNWQEVDTDALIIVLDMREAHEPHICADLVDLADYHFQAQLEGKHICDLAVVETVAPEDRNLAFKRVLFVFRHKSSAEEAVLAALRFADSRGFKNVVIPMETFFLDGHASTSAVQEMYVRQVRPALSQFRNGVRNSLNLVFVATPPSVEAPQSPEEPENDGKR